MFVSLSDGWLRVEQETCLMKAVTAQEVRKLNKLE